MDPQMILSLALKASIMLTLLTIPYIAWQRKRGSAKALQGGNEGQQKHTF
jgi:hypothetical protein